MQLVRQPKDSNLCGQACVAMVLGLTLEGVRPLFKKWGRTYTRDLVHALRAGDPTLRVPDRLLRVSKHEFLVPILVLSTAICKFRWSGTWRSHWVVWFDGKFWDPEEDGACGAQITAYLPVERKVWSGNEQSN